MTALTFDVPLPPRALSPNGYKHWRTVSAARKAYREAVHMLALSALRECGPMPYEKARVSLTFAIAGGRAVKGYQPRDIPNAVSAWKAGFDGLTDAGLLRDDSREWMTLGAVEICSKHGPYVRVRVEEAGDD